YAASCNPSRRAKKLDKPLVDGLVQHRPAILPKPTAETELTPDLSDSPPPPSRRGRKPGIASRSARETQRKLNHSIIEKARRTKINDALATLKELIPRDFATKSPAAAAEEDDDDDEEYGPKKSKGNGEKEFKLEILVKTVAYMQTLLTKVSKLEDQLGSSCPECSAPSLKRKRSTTDDGGESESSKKYSKPEAESRLPSIASWLPQIDPSLLSPSEMYQLPSPASTHLSPVLDSTPPLLTLTPSLVSAEEEAAVAITKLR
ncbi:hypothetical protein C8J56DRAFT_750458, partial [Mycena floridula]